MGQSSPPFLRLSSFSVRVLSLWPISHLPPSCTSYRQRTHRSVAPHTIGRYSHLFPLPHHVFLRSLPQAAICVRSIFRVVKAVTESSIEHSPPSGGAG
jgi:hypothetical protein